MPRRVPSSAACSAARSTPASRRSRCPKSSPGAPAKPFLAAPVDEAVHHRLLRRMVEVHESGAPPAGEALHQGRVLRRHAAQIVHLDLHQVHRRQRRHPHQRCVPPALAHDGMHLVDGELPRGHDNGRQIALLRFGFSHVSTCDCMQPLAACSDSKGSAPSVAYFSTRPWYAVVMSPPEERPAPSLHRQLGREHHDDDHGPGRGEPHALGVSARPLRGLVRDPLAPRLADRLLDPLHARSARGGARRRRTRSCGSRASTATMPRAPSGSTRSCPSPSCVRSRRRSACASATPS